MELKKERNGCKAAAYWFMTAGYMLIIFILSSQESLSIPHVVEHIDKIIHICAYVPLSFLMYASFSKSGMTRYVFAVAFILASMYGITDELHQTLVQGRCAAVGDVMADTLGALLGSAGASLVKI